jgi:hypothetical protein
VRLYEKSILFGVKTAGDIKRERLVGAAAKLCGHLMDGYRVKVNYAVKAFIFVGKGGKILYRAEIVSYRKVSRGLNA